METKDRWWLGSASLSGEEYPYLLRKLEYWGTTFNNASLTTKASQLRLPLSRSSSPTLSLRNWSNLCILLRDVHDTIEILDDRKKNLRFVSKKFAFRGRSERGSLRFQFRIGNGFDLDHPCNFFFPSSFLLPRIVHSTEERGKNFSLITRGTWSDSASDYPPDLLPFIPIPAT